ncbi:ATP-dependent nuclease [Salinibacter ruber]|uniref:ATP-dependent nuclease n=1 Tax=Salinibacter ruber TaxID=146919 RepID=UPI00216AA145|nr:AAA family ATPase [Salinibacter ruber]MCS3702340.1 putative ATP-dependent endonuclease of OLD family [Salinibacter ruber]
MEPVALEISVTNLRGFFNASLSLDRERTVLVGRNNSGKTSILLLLRWLLNEADDEVLKGERALDKEEQQLLLPERSARHRARRMLLRVYVSSTEKQSDFKCNSDGIARLIFGYRMSKDRAALRLLPPGRDQPKRGRSFDTEEEALDLLGYLQQNLRFIYIPSFRDVGSERFDETIREAYMARLQERALHPNKRGAPREKQQINDMLSSLEEMVENLVQPMWGDVQEGLPPEMTEQGKIEFDVSRRDFVEWVVNNLDLQVSTGERDDERVELSGVGSGLQSLLDLTIHSTGIEADDRHTILVVEEPEAFLHPTAQRTVARQLFDTRENTSIIVTTHSPLIVDETNAGDVVVTKEHKFYEPDDSVDQRREEINTALMTGNGSEAMFSHSVLLVEGEGDQLFFETLRRRMARVDSTGQADRVHVIAAGGKKGFSPWIQLFRSYLLGNERPIRYLVVPDADAGSEVLTAFNDAGQSIPQTIRNQVSRIGQLQGEEDDLVPLREAVEKCNQLCREQDVNFRFLNPELEHAMLLDASSELIQRLCDKFDSDANDNRSMIQWLLNPKASGRKAPWKRGFIGSHIDHVNITSNLRLILRDWLTGVMSEDEAEDLINRKVW